MLRDIYVIKDLNTLYQIQFGTSLDWDTLYPIIQSLSSYFEKSSEDKIDFMNVGVYRITYSTDIKNKMFFIFLSDLTDAMDDLEKQLKRAHEEFMSMFEDFINDSIDQAIYASFKPIAEMIHQNLRPKIALVGFSGVGKTTISKLIRAEEIPMDHVPTMTGDIVTIKIGKLYFHLWDFAGQEQFSFLWPQFIQDSDAVLIVNDSTIQNIDKSKFFIDLVKREVPNARVSAIANKQDLPEAMDPKKVEKLLGVKAYGMIAVDPENRAKMIHIIGEILNLSPQISPLIRPLLDRDKAIEEAESLLKLGNFQEAIQKFKNIAALSRELGDDKLSIEFSERAKLIESKLKTKKEIPQIRLDIPKIPEDSKQHHLKKSPLDIERETSISSSVLIPSSQYIKSIENFDFINRNLNSIISNNYLNVNFNNIDKNQISEIFSNLSEISLPDFFKNVKTQINYTEMPIFTNITTLEKDSDLTIKQFRTKSETAQEALSIDSIEQASKNSQKRLEEILNNEEISTKEKIKYLKDEISSIEKKMKEIKDNLENKTISEKNYDELNKKLREEKIKLQEKISDLSIQEIKRFDVSFPT